MKLFRSRDGILLGVCQGLAEWSGYPVRYFRLAIILTAFFVDWWVFIIYLGLAILMPVRRPSGYDSDRFKETFSDLGDDARDFAKREYKNFKDATGSRQRGESKTEKGAI